jgi:VWFA-related protein
MQPRLLVLSVIVVVAIAVSLRSQQRPSAQGQPAPQEKPKLKHFGSSLDRLRWDKEKQAAVEKTSPARTREDAEDVIRVETQLIAADVMVVDKQGRAVTGLTKDDFVIAEDGQPQPIGHFSLGSDLSVPKSIVLIIDYSGSETAYMAKSISAAKVLIDQLGAKDRMAIVTDDVELLVNFTSDKKKLSHALDDLTGWIRTGHKGKSRQFSALLAVARELISNEDIRPIIIFQTDGDEIGLMQPPHKDWGLRKDIRPFSLSDVLFALDKSRATVYTVIPNIRVIGVPPEEFPERGRELIKRFFVGQGGDAPSFSNKELQRQVEDFFLPMQQAAAKVATATGGWTAFLELPEQADEIYERILADVNSRYVVGYYYPAGRPRDGKRHQFSITVKDHPEYQVAGRKSYVAPEPNQ